MQTVRDLIAGKVSVDEYMVFALAQEMGVNSVCGCDTADNLANLNEYWMDSYKAIGGRIVNSYIGQFPLDHVLPEVERPEREIKPSKKRFFDPNIVFSIAFISVIVSGAIVIHLAFRG